ncbi:MAG TPA: hypothetical protein VMS98_05440 [Thermoanaerobaculia bacterium]|nr:hypothetical protein [Thermoanaerobaculia bacterium]
MFVVAMSGTMTMACYRDDNLNKTYASIQLHELIVKDTTGKILWSFRADNAPRKIRVVRYTEIPAGYVETSPETGVPRSFVPGEKISVLIVSTDIVGCSRGTASGTQSFRQHSYATADRLVASEWRQKVLQCAP